MRLLSRCPGIIEAIVNYRNLTGRRESNDLDETFQILLHQVSYSELYAVYSNEELGTILDTLQLLEKNDSVGISFFQVDSG